MLSARDLPPCDLSDHLEKRLARALQMERLAGLRSSHFAPMRALPHMQPAMQFIASLCPSIFACSVPHWRASTPARSVRQRGSQVRPCGLQATFHGHMGWSQCACRHAGLAPRWSGTTHYQDCDTKQQWHLPLTFACPGPLALQCAW